MRSLLYSGVALLTLAALARAELPPGPVGEAIKRGADYLKGLYSDSGQPDGGHGTGPASLTGLALLEAGVPTTDPAIQTIASQVRSKVPTETGTYQNSLAILFLDRLNDTSDTVLVQQLGVRLYGGISATGGFGYQLPELPAGVNPQAGTADPAPPKKDLGFLPVKPGATAKPKGPDFGSLRPEVARQYLAVRQRLAVQGRANDPGDNSNTQFGLIGLWVAKRRGVPVEDALSLVGARFISTQNAADGGWGYKPGTPSSPPMTCAGLLGLAVGAAPKPKPKDARADDPFYNPPAAKGAPKDEELPASKPTRAGLTLLARLIATVPANKLSGLTGHGDEYYLLWSIERVAVGLGLDTLGGLDWHRWGCEFLLPAQNADGSWRGQYQNEVSTAFAMLFLLRANFTKDLTSRLRGQNADPGKAELRGGMGFRPAARPDDVAPPGSGEDRPQVVPEAGQLADALVNPETFAPTLAECRDGKGSSYTQAMLAALPRLNAERQETVRTALATRLTRMTPATLKAQLADPNAELRRAAAVAAGTRRERSVAGSLADRVADPDESVAQAARTALRIISNRDFGPEPGATDAQKQAARTKWSQWVLTGR